MANSVNDPSGGLRVLDYSYSTQAPLYFQTSSLSTSAVTLASIVGTIPSWVQMALIVVETSSGVLRYRCDGTAPTTSVGMQVTNGNAPWPVQGAAALAAMQLISTSGTLTVSIELRG